MVGVLIPLDSEPEFERLTLQVTARAAFKPAYQMSAVCSCRHSIALVSKMGICRREGGGFGVHSARRPLGERGVFEWTFIGKENCMFCLQSEILLLFCPVEFLGGGGGWIHPCSFLQCFETTDWDSPASLIGDLALG